MMQTNDLCFFIQSVSDWNLPQIKFRILQKLVSSCAVFKVRRAFAHLRFLIFMRTLKTIQTRDSVRRFGFAFACLSYLIGLTAHLSIRSPFSVDPGSFQVSVAILISTLNSSLSTLYQPIDLRIRTTYSVIHFSLERR